MRRALAARTGIALALNLAIAGVASADIHVCRQNGAMVVTDAICFSDAPAQTAPAAAPQQAQPSPMQLPDFTDAGSNFCTDPVYGEMLRRIDRVKRWLGGAHGIDRQLPPALPEEWRQGVRFDTPTRPALQVWLDSYESQGRGVAFDVNVDGPDGTLGKLWISGTATDAGTLEWSCRSTLPSNYLTPGCDCPPGK
jgi:hypothetical protein